MVKHSYLVKNTNDLPRIAREAYHIATTGRPGPVLIDVPKDMSQAPFTGDLNAEMDLPGYHPEEDFKIDKKSVQEAAKLIMQSKRPVILAGHGAMIARADKELMSLAETLNCPVTSTLLGKGVFPETHRLQPRHARACTAPPTRTRRSANATASSTSARASTTASSANPPCSAGTRASFTSTSMRPSPAR